MTNEQQEQQHENEHPKYEWIFNSRECPDCKASWERFDKKKQTDKPTPCNPAESVDNRE